jgi:hypothetical protein
MGLVQPSYFFRVIYTLLQEAHLEGPGQLHQEQHPVSAAGAFSPQKPCYTTYPPSKINSPSAIKRSLLI